MSQRNGREIKNKAPEAIQQVLEYFHFFEYAPDMDEVYTYLPVRITRHEMNKALDKLEKANKIEVVNGQYALQGYGTLFKKKAIRKEITKKKLKKIQRYISILSMFPLIQLIGLSGSCAMQNASADDDIDLFIISSSRRMWTVRFMSIVVAELMGLRRRRGDNFTTDKVCLNLFFDREDIVIPKHKRSLYTAHELVQMRPLYIRGDAYTSLLQSNMWVENFLPNAYDSRDEYALDALRCTSQPNLFNSLIAYVYTPIGIVVEFALKAFQRLVMKKHQTTEIITDTQLWFFPHDVEHELEKFKVI